MFNVIIPSIFTNQLDELMYTIQSNTIFPSRIIVVNNSSEPWEYPGDLPIRYIKPKKRLSCNESWNEGLAEIEINCKYVSILNDDLLLGRRFFEHIHLAFEAIPRACCICPDTTTDLKVFRAKIGNFSSPIPEPRLMRKREGWAMTFRREVITQVPRIPTNELRTFCGDDWYWKHTQQNGRRWYRDHANLIYHAVGSTVKAFGLQKTDLKKEKTAFSRLAK